MLHHHLQLVQSLVDPGFRRGQGVHLGKEGGQLPPQPVGQGGEQLCDGLALGFLVGVGLLEGGDVSGDRLPNVVDEAHAQHLVHVHLRQRVPQQQGQHGQPPGVLRHRLVPPGGGPGVAGVALELLQPGQEGQKFLGFHPYISFSSLKRHHRE